MFAFQCSAIAITRRHSSHHDCATSRDGRAHALAAAAAASSSPFAPGPRSLRRLPPSRRQPRLANAGAPPAVHPGAAPARATLRDYSWCTTPTYTGDAKEDLLQAVRYDDGNKFHACLAALGGGVAAANTTWGGNRYNQSVLLACCFRGRTCMVEHLVASGADCAHTNDFGWGAVRYAKQYYYVLEMREEGDRVIELLVKNGAEDTQEWRPNDGVKGQSTMDIG